MNKVCFFHFGYCRLHLNVSLTHQLLLNYRDISQQNLRNALPTIPKLTTRLVCNLSNVRNLFILHPICIYIVQISKTDQISFTQLSFVLSLSSKYFQRKMLELYPQPSLNPSNAKASFIQSTRMQKPLKTI